MGAWLDLFAGHGVGVGLRELGVEEFAVEQWQPAIDTRLANGLAEPVYRDVWDVHRAEVLDFQGMWASPPCQTFSAAGKGHGSRNLQSVLQALEGGEYKTVERLKGFSTRSGDDRTGLVLSPLHYIYRYEPAYVVLEQVPPVLRVWKAYQEEMKSLGYSSWAGVVNAADYGVPQNRRRAYLVASKRGEVRLPPTERHTTMYEALGWGMLDRPAPTVTSHTGVTRSAKGTQQYYEREIRAGRFVFNPEGSPNPSKVAKKGIASRYAPGLINTTVRDELKLQTYPEEFELAGPKGSWGLQVGNAVPPLLAQKIVRELVR